MNKNLFLNKNIILTGSNDSVQAFYKQYKSKLNIVYIIEDNENIELELKKIKLKDISKVENAFIIVCSEEEYSDNEKILIKLGYTYYKDFINSQMVSSVFEGKKMAVFAGICHVRRVYHALNTVDFFYNEYYLMNFESKFLKNDEIYKQKFKDILKEADIFIYNYFSDIETIDFFENLKKECFKGISVSLPVIHFNGLWPQERRRNMYRRPNHYAGAFLEERAIQAFCPQDANVIELLEKRI